MSVPVQPLRAISKAVRDRLLTSSALVALLKHTSSKNKIWFGHNTINEDFPFINIEMIYGSDTNRAPNRMFDITVLIYGVSENVNTSEEIAAYIDNLLTYNWLTDGSRWRFFVPVRKTNEYYDNIKVANRDFFVMGGYYRVRGELI